LIWSPPIYTQTTIIFPCQLFLLIFSFFCSEIIEILQTMCKISQLAIFMFFIKINMLWKYKRKLPCTHEMMRVGIPLEECHAQGQYKIWNANPPSLSKRFGENSKILTGIQTQITAFSMKFKYRQILIAWQ